MSETSLAGEQITAADRLAVELHRDEKFCNDLLRTLETLNKAREKREDWEASRAFQDLKRLSPDLNLDGLDTLQILSEQPPLEIGQRLSYLTAQKVYTAHFSETYGKIRTDQQRGECHRQCSEWAGYLVLKYGPETAKVMVPVKCLLREMSLSDEQLHLFVETMVEMYPDLLKRIMGEDLKPKPSAVFRDLFGYKVSSLRKYLVRNLHQWIEILFAWNTGVKTEETNPMNYVSLEKGRNTASEKTVQDEIPR